MTADDLLNRTETLEGEARRLLSEILRLRADVIDLDRRKQVGPSEFKGAGGQFSQAGKEDET